MNGLVYKDYIEIKDDFKRFFVSAILLTIYGAMTKSFFMLMVFPILISTNGVLNIFTKEKMVIWESYIISLPISKLKIVMSKYIFSFLILSIFNIISFLFSLGINYYLKLLPINELILYYILIFLVTIFFIDIIIPISFKFNMGDARVMTSGVFLAIVFIFYLMEKYIGLKIIINNSFLIFILTLLFTIISIYLTEKILKNKEY